MRPDPLASVLKHEAGYWDDPIGGPTNFGIRQVTLNTYRDRYPEKGLPTFVQDLTDSDARFIYNIGFARQWKGIRHPLLELVLAHLTVMSWDDGVRLLQKRLGVATDGVTGPKTLAAANNLTDSQSIGISVAVVVDFLAKFKDHQFVDGYVNRLTEVVIEGLS